MNTKNMSKRMNVLMMVSWYGAYEPDVTSTSFHYTQAVGLKKYCNIAIYYPYDRSMNGSFEGHQEKQIYVYRSKYQLEKKLRNRIYMYQAMKRIVKEFKPDLIHAQVATEVGRFAVILGKVFHIPVMITEHSSPDYSGVTSFPHHFYADIVYRHSCYNVCVSDYVTQKLSNIFPQYVFHTIYNGINTKLDLSTTEKYRRSDYINTCIVTGHYDKYIKGIPMLLEILKELVQEGNQIMLHLVGGGEYTDYFKDMARNLSIDANCIFYGNVSKKEVYSIISQMDFLVSASRVESFGCNIAEALVIGKPVIATKCGGPESLVNESNGILVEKDNPGMMKEAIIKMMHTYTDYNAEEIRREAIEKCDLDKISRRYFDIYSDILEKAK